MIQFPVLRASWKKLRQRVVEIKICGLSTRETMAAALDAGADYVGLVFYQPSPRNISIEKAIALADMARGKSKIVALTVDPDDTLVDDIAKNIRPDFFQCHGSESPQRICEITGRTEIPVIKALKIRDEEDLSEAPSYDGTAAMMLYDAKVPVGFKNPLPGGNGVRFDWSLLDDQSKTKAFMLSGGIDISNVADAIAIANPAIVDVSSGVESEPGIKEITLIGAFVEHAKSV